MITLADFWMGRDKKYPGDLTDEIRENAEETVSKVNDLLAIYEAETGIELNTVSSGWRPKSVNDVTSSAGAKSKHLRGLACDIRDISGVFPRWCARNLEHLVACGLYMEDWHWTPTWCHLQVVPPGSGRRMYMPFDPNEEPPPIPLDETP